MNIRIRLYATYREQAGRGSVDVALPDGAAAVADAIMQLLADVPSLPPSFKPHLIAVNDEFANPQYPLNDGDEVALYPPVSGGVDARITHETIDARDVAESVRRASNGAIVTFEGTTRDNTNGERVRWLEYEADERMAQKVLTQVMEETIARFGVGEISVVHRIGHLEIGDVSLVVAVGAPHRLEAFLASLYIVDRIKHIVPVWKKEQFDNGSVWVGAACDPETHATHLAIAPYAGFLAERESASQHGAAQHCAHQHTHAS